MRAVCDVGPALEVGVNPFPGVGVVTGSAADPLFDEACARTDMMPCIALAAFQPRLVLPADVPPS